MLPRIGFHDSTLLSIRQAGTSLLLELRGVQLPRGHLLDLADCHLSFNGVRDLAIDGAPHESELVMEGLQGEVEDILENAGAVVLIITWPIPAFPTCPKTYTFDCDSISCELGVPYETFEY